MHNIRYEVISEDGLHRELYQYYPLAQLQNNSQVIRLILDSYHAEVRRTIRHKWRDKAHWERIGRDQLGSIRRVDVPTPESVRQAVLKQLVDSITIE